MTGTNQQLQEQDFQKMRQFIERLFLNPNFSNLPDPEVEGILINFLRQNERQLVSTFASPEYFPGLAWRDIQVLFFSVLKSVTLSRIQPKLTKLLDTKVDFKVLAAFLKSPTFNLESARVTVLQFLEKIINNRDVRQEFDVTFKLIEHDYIEKYVGKVFERREHIFNMLTRQDSLQHLQAAEVADYIKISLLLRNVVFMKLPVAQGNAGNVTRLNLIEVQDRPALKKIFLEKLSQMLVDDFSDFPQPLLTAAINSNRDCNEEIEQLSAVARFLAIVSKRGKDYSPWMKVDKGAEQPDKSWFRIALRNYQYHGIDKGMLEEFYKIAADENW